MGMERPPAPILERVVRRPETVSSARAGAVIDELRGFARQPDGQTLIQFRSLVGAHQYRRLYDLVARYLEPGSRVLDWGAGCGHGSYYLLRAGHRVTAFTLGVPSFGSWFPEEACRLVAGDPAEPRSLPFGSAEFDAVVSIGVLEHVRETGGDEAASLREIRRILRPGGTFLCYHLPNRYSAIDWLARTWTSKHHHRFRFTSAQIRILVAAAGLVLVETDRYGILPRNAWGRGPRRIVDSRIVARGWDLLDAVLVRLLPNLAQNHAFVARRPAGSEPLAADPSPAGH